MKEEDEECVVQIEDKLRKSEEAAAQKLRRLQSVAAVKEEHVQHVSRE